MLVYVPPSGSLTAGELSLAAMADFLAENLLRGEGSYRQFWRRRALGEGSYRRFFWQRICRACRLRGQASKGEEGIGKCRKSFQKGAKKGSKWYPGGIWEPPGKDFEKRPIPSTITYTLLGPWSGHWRHDFFHVFRVPSRNDLWAILEPKRPPKGRPLGVNLGTFSKTRKV